MSGFVLGRPGPSLLRAVVLVGDQEPVPAQDRIRCHDAGDVRETLPSEGLPFHGESAPLVVGEANASRAVCRAEDPVLLQQVLDDVLLLSIDPAGEQQEQEGERGRQPIHWRQCTQVRIEFQSREDRSLALRRVHGAGVLGPTGFTGIVRDPASAEFSHRTWSARGSGVSLVPEMAVESVRACAFVPLRGRTMTRAADALLDYVASATSRSALTTRKRPSLAGNGADHFRMDRAVIRPWREHHRRTESTRQYVSGIQLTIVQDHAMGKRVDVVPHDLSSTGDAARIGREGLRAVDRDDVDDDCVRWHRRVEGRRSGGASIRAGGAT